MTDREFLERMTFLVQKLCDVTDKDGYGTDAYNAVMDELHELGESLNRSHRRRSWYMFFIICCFLYFLAWLIWAILF